MKGMLAVLLLISVANANPTWGGYWNRRFVPPPPPPKPVHVHDQDFGEPVPLRDQWPIHTHSPRCQLLENLFSMPSCTIASICRNPGTGEIVISELTESQLMTLGNPQDRFRNGMSNNNPTPCNGMSDKIDPDNMKNNYENDNNPKNDGRDNAASPMPIPTSPPYHGGEGIIDVRIGEDD